MNPTASWCLNLHVAPDEGPYPGIFTAFDSSRSLVHQHKSCLWQGYQPKLGPGCSVGPYNALTLGACYSGLYEPGSIPLRHQESHRWRSRSWESVWSLVAYWVTDKSTDSGCSSSIETDVNFGNSPDLDVIVVLASIEDCPECHGPSGNMAPNTNMSLGGSQDLR